MKNIPKGFIHHGAISCSSCYHISINSKTQMAYCSENKITFPLIISTEKYSCLDHKPIIGKWDGLKIREEK